MTVFALDEILLWWDGRRLFTFKRLLPAFETFGFLRAGIGSFQLLPLLLAVPPLLHGDFGRGLASGTESGTCRFSRRRPLDLSSTPFLDFVGELSKAVMFDLR